MQCGRRISGCNRIAKEEVTEYIDSLENKLQRYLPELTEEEAALLRNPFSASIDIARIPNEVQDEFLDLRNDSSALNLFDEKPLTYI